MFVACHVIVDRGFRNTSDSIRIRRAHITHTSGPVRLAICFTSVSSGLGFRSQTGPTLHESSRVPRGPPLNSISTWHRACTQYASFTANCRQRATGVVTYPHELASQLAHRELTRTGLGKRGGSDTSVSECRGFVFCRLGHRRLQNMLIVEPYQHGARFLDGSEFGFGVQVKMVTTFLVLGHRSNFD
jgi:hypothetical protein